MMIDDIQFAEARVGTSRRDLGCCKWKNLSASALEKHLENKEFPFKCAKFPKKNLSARCYSYLLVLLIWSNKQPIWTI